MAGKKASLLDVREMIRRFRLQQSDRQVARHLRVNRRTVMKYRRIAREAGWIEAADMPPEAEVAARVVALAARASQQRPGSTVNGSSEVSQRQRPGQWREGGDLVLCGGEWTREQRSRVAEMFRLLNEIDRRSRGPNAN